MYCKYKKKHKLTLNNIFWCVKVLMKMNLNLKKADRFIVNHDRRQTAGNLHEIGFPISNRCFPVSQYFLYCVRTLTLI